MACIRKRRGKYVVDYRDGAGVRRWVTCDTKREADDVLSEKVRTSRQATRPAVDPKLTLEAYSQRWLDLISSTVKPTTLRSYRDTLRLHILPALGRTKLAQLHKARVKLLLTAKLGSDLARGSVRVILATLRAMLNAAVDDGVLLVNPADKLGRQLRLVPSKVARQEQVKAFTREQLATFLDTAEREEAAIYPLLFCLARTGMRLGEALALQWDDFDFTRREVRVVRARGEDGSITTPKSGHGRTVDVSQQLVALLRHEHHQRKAEKLRHGLAELSPWVFSTSAGTPFDHANVAKAFKRVLKEAALPGHHSPHGLRHTFASLLLQAGESPAYVQRQLGHASIQLTVDTYGKWLPLGNKAAVDHLDTLPEEARAAR